MPIPIPIPNRNSQRVITLGRVHIYRFFFSNGPKIFDHSLVQIFRLSFFLHLPPSYFFHISLYFSRNGHLSLPPPSILLPRRHLTSRLSDGHARKQCFSTEFVILCAFVYASRKTSSKRESVESSIEGSVWIG